MRNRVNRKGVIVCIHGNSSSAKVFDDFLRSDSISNAKVAVELKGHGANQSKRYELDDFFLDSQKKHIIDKLSDIHDAFCYQ